jgi:transposase
MSTTLDSVCLMAVAIEIAASKWVVASTAGVGGIRRKALTQETAHERFEALLSELEQARNRLKLAEGTRVVVGYEAGQEGFWLVRALQERGIEAVVIDPVSLPVDRRQRRAKTDRLDAEALVMALWRAVAGDVRALRFVRVPSRLAEDAREWQRERDRLAGQRRGCADRIGKKLRTHGIWALSRGWREALRQGQLKDFGGRALGPMLQAALRVELDRLEAAESALRAMEVQASELDQESRKRIERLEALRGIGPVGARLLSLRLYWRDFDNRRQVGACVGLVGVPFDSGTSRQDQGISKVGDPVLRAGLIELAWLWLRYQPESALTAWFNRRTQGAGARGKRVMIVAVARRLAIALWRYLEQGAIPEGAMLKAAA